MLLKVRVERDGRGAEADIAEDAAVVQCHEGEQRPLQTAVPLIELFVGNHADEIASQRKWSSQKISVRRGVRHWWPG